MMVRWGENGVPCSRVDEGHVDYEQGSIPHQSIRNSDNQLFPLTGSTTFDDHNLTTNKSRSCYTAAQSF